MERISYGHSYFLIKKGNVMGMIFCRGCGKEIHESAATCPHCGAPQVAQAVVAKDAGKAWNTGRMVFYSLASFFLPLIGVIAGIMGMLKEATRKQGIVLLVLAVAGVGFYASISKHGGASKNTPPTAQAEPSKAAPAASSSNPSLEDYRSKAKNMDYRKAMFEEYQRGELFEITGVVNQVVDDQHIAVFTRRDEMLGYVEDRVMIKVKGAKVLENDVVKIYARYDGTLEYQTVLGAQAKVPKMIADYLDVSTLR